MFLILMLICSVTGSGFFWSARSTKINPLNSAYGQADGFATYESHNLGFKIQYPSGWKVEEEPDPLNFVTINPPNIEKLFKISVVDLSKNVNTLGKFMKYEASSSSDFKLINSDTNARLGTHTAFLAHYKSVSPLWEVLEKGMILNSSKGYLLDYMGADDFTKYLPIAQKMFDSFRLSSEPEPPEPLSLPNNQKQENKT